ncbi:hypothetical protein CR513_22269, partial [Mucuna pruriens]
MNQTQVNIVNDKLNNMNKVIYSYTFKVTLDNTIFHSLWRPHVITLRAFKDLKKLPMEEHLSTLKVHRMKLNKDIGQQKGKFVVLKAHKAPKGLASKPSR